MKFTVGVLSLCFFVTHLVVKAEQPLCNILDTVSNVTGLIQIFTDVFHGETRPAECLFGCAVYTINREFENDIKKLLGPLPYSFFENCIKSGKRTRSTCKITDCMKDFAVFGIHMLQSANIKIPFLDVILSLLDKSKPQYIVNNQSNYPKTHYIVDNEPNYPKTNYAVDNEPNSPKTQNKVDNNVESTKMSVPTESPPVPTSEPTTSTPEVDKEAHVDQSGAPPSLLKIGLSHICWYLIIMKCIY